VLAKELESAGISVTPLEKTVGPSLRVLAGLRSSIAKLRPDIVHTHNSTAHYYTAGASVGLPKVTLVNTRHGMGCRRDDRRETLFQLAARRTKAVVAVCEQSRARFVNDGLIAASLARVVPNGIAVDRFEPAGDAERARAKRELGLAPASLTIGTVGRLNWAKDHALLIDSFALMRRSIPDASLVIAGGGELYHDLSGRVQALGLSDCVVMTGDRQDVPLLIRAFDVFAMSSRTEGYSIALLEAAAAGLPMVATDVGGNREIVRHNVSGLLVPHGDARSLADALALLAANKTLRDRMGCAARLWASEHATIESMMNAYTAVYEEALGAKFRAAGAVA
jgi:glycosyltransferase involved in cell wall biosynthesis